MQDDDLALLRPSDGPPPPSRGCLLAKWYVLLPTILVLVFGGCCATCGGLAWTIGRAATQGPITAEAVRLAEQDPAVTAALGTPLKAKFEFTRSPSFSSSTGNGVTTATASLGLHGPNGAGLLQYDGKNNNGTITFTQLTVTPDGGQPINLLAPTNPPPTTP